MNQTSANKKIAFANALRGIASLSVLLAHYVVMFSIIKGAVQGFPPVPGNTYPRWLVQLAMVAPDFEIGAFGVALFFLVSGFVIPNSIASLPDSFRGRLGFVVARIFRIWPTYLVGFCVSMCALCIAAVHSNALAYMPYWHITLENVLIHATLFRDWFNTPMLDGIVWTLEIEIKFYLFALLFWRGIANGRAYVFAAIAVAALLAIPYKPIEMVGMEAPANFLFALRFILFMFIGVAFNYHLRGLLNLKKMFFYAAAMLLIFIYCSIEESAESKMTISCCAAFLAFLGLYLFKSGWSGGRVFTFLADISYPMYVSHAVFGYVGMRWMIEIGFPALIALSVQTAVTISLSWSIHRIIEAPTHRLGKSLSKIVAGKPKQSSVARDAMI
ncbi:acyltransferase family protein [Paraburkholderia sp. GAS42]|uniref:acyltransferase family protein n=1 Tax=Paraburkholderia sp. GAS42 TaxID=3035135 RepID=UPI003D248DD8